MGISIVFFSNAKYLLLGEKLHNLYIQMIIFVLIMTCTRHRLYYYTFRIRYRTPPCVWRVLPTVHSFEPWFCRSNYKYKWCWLPVKICWRKHIMSCNTYMSSCTVNKNNHAFITVNLPDIQMQSHITKYNGRYTM